MSSEDQIAKLREQYEKSLAGLSGAFAEEKKLQYEKMVQRIQERADLHERAKEEKRNQLKIAEQKAEEDRLKEIERIKELRIRRAQLETTLAESQKLIYKQCYSRPLWPFNRMQFEHIKSNEDFAWLTDAHKDEEAQKIVDSLFKEVQKFESVVETDVAHQNRIKYQKPGNSAGHFLELISSKDGS